MGNDVDKSKLITILCRLNNISTKYNKGDVQFNSGYTFSHMWLQILIDNIWYVADATSQKNTLGTINNWNASTINNLEQGNYYNNTTLVQINNLEQNYNNTPLNTNLESINPIEFNNSDYSILTNNHNILDPFTKLNCTLSFDATPNNYIIVYLKDMNNNPLINKFVTISINDTILTFCTDFEGSANLGHFNTGTYYITGIFTGDDKYNAYVNNTMVELNKLSPIIKIPNNVISIDDKLSILIMDNNNLPLSNFNINIMINNSSYNLVSDNYGNILFNHNLSIGDYNVYCTFNGNDNYYPTQYSFILKIREKTKINSSRIVLLKSDTFKICLTDGNNTPLSNKNINITFYDSSFNLYHSAFETTDSEGCIYVYPLNNGTSTILFSFMGDDYYLMSYYSTIVYNADDNEHFDSFIYFENAHNKEINIHRKGDYLIGRLVDSLYNPIRNSLINISILDNGININNYIRLSDDNGYFRLRINYNPVNLIIICKYLGDDKYSSCISSVYLNVSHNPDFVYSVNITTLDKTSDGLLIPYGREIGIYKNNSLYKFGYEYVAVDVTPLNNNQLYFISFEDSSAIQEIGSIDLITSSGILLYSNNGYVSIRYYGYFTNLTSFNVIFDGKQYNGKYISNVTLFQNNIIVGSFYFSSEIFTQNTQTYLYNQLNHYYSEYKVYCPIMTNLTIFNHAEINSTFWESLYYGDTTYREDYINRGWNNTLGYEAVESYMFLDDDYITDNLMNYELGEYNNYDGANKVVYEAYLTCLTYNWLCDKFATQIGHKYDVNLIKLGYGLSGTHFGLGGRLFDDHCNRKFSGDGYCSYLANNEYGIMGSLLEQFVISLHGCEATCAVYEVIKTLINGGNYSLIQSDNKFIIKLDDNSSELVFYMNGGIDSCIFPDFLDEKYDLNGGKSLSNFSFNDLSEIFDNLMAMWENLKSPHSLAEYIVDYLNWDEDAIPICEFILGFSASIIGFELMSIGVAITVTGVGAAVGMPIIFSGLGLVVWSENIGENPFSSEGWIFLLVDFGTYYVGGKITRFVRSAGNLDMGIYSKIFVRSLRESFDTTVSSSIKVILDYYAVFNIEINDLYNEFIEFLYGISNQIWNI